MAVERELWRETFTKNDVPPFVCPACSKGRLTLDVATMHEEEPQHSKAAHDHEAWEPTWTQRRFVAFLRCGIKTCGEIVTMAGEVDVQEVADDEYGWTYEGFLKPLSLYPAPPVIAVPGETPGEITAELMLSFHLIWCDLRAAAGRMRTSVERLLDDFKIPREHKTASGKSRALSLAERITQFKTVEPDHADTFNALRFVGNIGAHGETLQREVLLDAFELYEDALMELYGKHSKTIAELRAKIIAKKGKY